MWKKVLNPNFSPQKKINISDKLLSCLREGMDEINLEMEAEITVKSPTNRLFMCTERGPAV